MANDLDPLYRRFAPGVPHPPEHDDLAMDAAAGLGEPVEPPVLGPAALEELKRQFANEPSHTLAMVRATYDARITEDELRELIVQLEAAFADPEAALAADAAIELALGKIRLPDAFTFPGIDHAAIAIQPANCRFETKRDALGWVLNTGHYWLRSKVHQPKARFRWAATSATNFHYPMIQAAQVTRLATFADAGTHLYHSRYIGRHIADDLPHHALYLGDVYYAGKQGEFQERFLADFECVNAATELLTLNANHEMFSGGRPYFRSIEDRRAAGRTRQEGSYFCLTSPRFRVIGIDTAYHESTRHRERDLTAWLSHTLLEGKRLGQLNLLFSSDHPYDLEKRDPERLLSDVMAGLPPGAVDLWVWGNVHYAALFGRDDDKVCSFLGACVGHGGYPYTRRTTDGEWGVVPVLWLEKEARFPAWTELRQDRGNNGYALLDLDHTTGHIAMRFVDWTHHDRLIVELAPRNGALEVVKREELPRAQCRG